MIHRKLTDQPYSVQTSRSVADPKRSSERSLMGSEFLTEKKIKAGRSYPNRPSIHMNDNHAQSAHALTESESLASPEDRAETLRRDLGEVFLAALADPKTVGLILNTDGTLFQEKAMESGHWRAIGKIDPGFTGTLTRTAASCLPATFPLREFRLDQPRPTVTAKPVVGSSLACACCRPKPIEEAPTPLFRFCWRRVGLIRQFLKNAEREELRAAPGKRTDRGRTAYFKNNRSL